VFKLVAGIVIGLALVAAGWWYYSDGGRRDPVEGFEDAVKYQSRKAVQAVEEKVDQGVTDLKQELDKAGERLDVEISDAKVLATIKTQLVRDKRFDGFDINVDVDHGKVTLRGRITSEEARVLAIKLARETPGVTNVRSELRLERPAQN
jgi:osmotically-inducible protein OsmY